MNLSKLAGITVFLILFSFSLNAQNSDVKEWTVIVFLNADNNLHAAGIDDINEMERIGSNDKINIVVQFDGKNEGDTVRYLIGKDESSSVSSKILEKMGEIDMGSWINFRDFVMWAIDNYPAKKYAAVVWNHGSGWIKTQFPDNLLMGISYDDDSYNHMTTPELGMALKGISDHLGRKIDIYGSDACLMGMLEVAYELREYADFVVGSEETEPFDGWAYDDMLSILASKPHMSAEELARAIVMSYGASYSGGSQGNDHETTQSAIKTVALGPFVHELDLISERMISFIPDHRQELLEVVQSTQSFSMAANLDLFDLLIKFNDAFEGILDVDGSLYRLGWFMSDLVVANYAGSEMPGALGLAVWFPKWQSNYQSNIGDYRDLKFAKDSIYSQILDRFHSNDQ